MREQRQVIWVLGALILYAGSYLALRSHGMNGLYLSPLIEESWSLPSDWRGWADLVYLPMIQLDEVLTDQVISFSLPQEL